MAKPTFKFKRVDAGKDPVSGRQLYQQIMLVDYDGKQSSYKSGRHASEERLKDDMKRMMASVKASLEEKPVTVKQNYGDAEFRTIGNENIAKTVKEGGQLKAPQTYQTTRIGDGMEISQTYNQRGIRQGEPVTRAPANMLDPNYDPVTDTIKPPVAPADSTAATATARTAAMKMPAKQQSVFNRPVSPLLTGGGVDDRSLMSMFANRRRMS